ncbi:S-adenosylmethionine decarboxylase [Methanoculleus taiwanensis]|uniref:S-adenosylmethionine decarboxylase n=1 Tax=Methanoculleus taiwanensis TaxID=1550565 RepID=A0A498H3M5_9EURY|nr:S-adenosylmethionine decarboxylase [Methanoculleus taiwanensis]RXE56728.1 S-adenosylmethionine decarboxylase [Methanoculleus taiwanensis]
MTTNVVANSPMANNAVASMVSDQEIIAEYKQRQAWGLYMSVDLKECDPAAIRDAETIHRFVVELCDLINMKRFGEPQIIHFGPNERVAGYSMTQLIETSCITAHFANETNGAYLDIFSCREYGPAMTAEFCKTFFGAKSVTYNVLFRD